MTTSPPGRFDPAFVGQLDTLLAWRRDVRHFRRDPLPEGMMDTLLSLAQLSPSVGNSQPWRFVRVLSPGLRASLADHADAEVARTAAGYEEERRAAYLALKLHGLREAPEILGVFSESAPDAGHGLGIATMPEALLYSTVMAIQTLWLAARARGVGLGWVSIVDPDAVAALLDVPAGWSFVAILCLGFPDAPSAVPELERRGWQDRGDWRGHVVER
ncbi:5,6-dimethylbenzimidazole synthase [Sphingomonas sp. QA11]|uniref:5,6-dimethylbenzimidazole synthase n=1 Tax=Sphingomonas sp. QA11 TaxID=2950605 RepID=UPI00234BEF26|nr:5,6-dimethylbenzimidazole synthase [Sphingomonas sp. QA11]WCM29889.1 5,6-dimethylbenzimidazole synthase [Sphingomonas sp. QA11]